MIDYNRKLSNERKTQVPSHRMSILVLLETYLYKISVGVILFYVQYQKPQLVLTPDPN